MFSQRFITLIRRATTAGVVVAATMTAGPLASAAPAPSDVVCPYRVTADWLRHRTAPTLGNNAPGQYHHDTVVLAKQDVVTNGFRQLANGEWAYAAFLRRTDGSCLR
jgi:hypothetical protein